MISDIISFVTSKEFLFENSLLILTLVISLTYALPMLYGAYTYNLNKEKTKSLLKQKYFYTKNAKIYKNDYAKALEYIRIVACIFVFCGICVSCLYLWHRYYTYHHTSFRRHFSFSNLVLLLPFIFLYLFNNAYFKKLKCIVKNDFFIIEEEQFYLVDVIVKDMPHIFYGAKYKKIKIKIQKSDILFYYKSFEPIISSSSVFYFDLKNDVKDLKKHQLQTRITQNQIWSFVMLFFEAFKLVMLLPFLFYKKFKIYTICQSKNFVFALPYVHKNARFRACTFLREGLFNGVLYLAYEDDEEDLEQKFIAQKLDKYNKNHTKPNHK